MNQRYDPDEGGDKSALVRIIRQDWGRVLATLARQFNDLSLAEDALQDAVEAGLRLWSSEPLPDQPAAWLYQTARRRAIDKVRRQQTFQSKQPDIAYHIRMNDDASRAPDPLAGLIEEEDEMQDLIPDDRLRLMFTCCHPAIDQNIRVPLTLQTLAGFTAAEIAHAFLAPEKTMAQRLVRAKRKIKAAGIPYAVPSVQEQPARLGAVLQVIYLIFNEGYGASKGDHIIRQHLCQEAIRLGEAMVELMPEEAEAAGLLALMLYHDARRTARLDDAGAMIGLEDQDRRLWDQVKARRAQNILVQAKSMATPAGPYQLQAMISGIHIAAPSFSDTDWGAITQCYDALYRLNPSPVIALNGIVAQSYRDLASALTALVALGHDRQMQTYQPYYAALADLQRRQGNQAEAKTAYLKAIDLSKTEQEKSFLEARLADL